VVVESQHAIALAREKAIPSRVAFLMRRLEMLPAVNFDDDLRRMRDEVHDVRSDRRLAAKADAFEAMRAQSVPNDPLGIGQISAQRARADAQLGRDLPGWFF